MNFRNALCFFTRLPVGSPDATASYSGATVWLPTVGLLIGLLLAPCMVLCASLFPNAVSGLLLCLAWVVITGGLHLDGVCDCGDGLLVAASRERRLEIMKDSRLGSYSAIVLFFVLGAKVTTLSVLCSGIAFDMDGLCRAFGICVPVACFARGMVFVALPIRSARPDGMGATGARGITTRHQLANAAMMLAVAACLGSGGFVLLAVALATAGLFLRYVVARIGGVTGDVFGCLVELTECAMLVALTCTAQGGLHG